MSSCNDVCTLCDEGGSKLANGLTAVWSYSCSSFEKETIGLTDIERGCC